MSAVSEWVVREYFEQLGYLVNQPKKHVASGRQKSGEREVDLLVINPTVAEHRVPEHVIWTTQDLAHIGRAVVAVRGWHTDRFYAGTFEQTPEILRFVEPAAVRFASRMLGSESVARILCVPALPASGELKEKTITLLREKGVNGVLSFQTILTDLIAGVQVNLNYEKSDLLQIFRILKIYEFFRDSQMELFLRKGRTVRRKAGRSEPSAGATQA